MKNNKGFSLIEILIALILIIGLILGGYYVWHSQKKNKKSAAKPPSSSQSAAAATKAPADTTKYLTIKEWGVKVPISQAIDGAYYTVRPNTGGPADYADLFDTKIDTTKNSDGTLCKDASFPLFVMVRIKTGDKTQLTDPSSQYYDPEQANDFKAIGDYSYSGSGFHQSYPQCETLKDSTQDSKVGTVYSDDKQAFIDAFAKLQAQ